MKNNTILLISAFTIITLSVGVTSCKKDDEPPPVKPKLSFTAPTLEVNEGDGIIEIEFTLDRAALEDMVVEYALGGTAKDRASVGANAAFDYEILSEPGEVEILKGETSGFIELQLTSDYFIEDPETIEVSIEGVDSDMVEITRDDEVEITVNQEDGLSVWLFWPEPTADSTADMDILVRKGASASSWDSFVTGSVQETFTAPEYVFIPKGINDATFGLSYTYYDGTMKRLPFEVLFVDVVNGEFEAEAGYQAFEGVYTAANKNKWTDPSTSVVVQSFRKSGGNAVDITNISVPTSGSRMSHPGMLPATVKKLDRPLEQNKVVTSFLRAMKRLR